MDQNLVGLVAVVLLFGGGTLFLLAISPIGKAIAARLLGRRSAVMDEDEIKEALKQIRAEREELRAGGEPEALEALRTRVAELEERLDFAERLLAQRREGERLPPGRA